MLNNPRGSINKSEKPIIIQFDYNSPPSISLQSVKSGSTLYRATLLITQRFNGVGASLQLGTVTQPNLILGIDFCAVGRLGQYETTRLREFSISDFLVLELNLNGSTTGAGTLLYQITS